LRYIRAYSQMEVRFVSEGKVARFFRWTEDHMVYDVETVMGVITVQARERLLEMLSSYLQGRTDIKPFSMHERILFKVDQETDKFLIIPLMRPPIVLSHQDVADLYLFLR